MALRAALASASTPATLRAVVDGAALVVDRPRRPPARPPPAPPAPRRQLVPTSAAAASDQQRASAPPRRARRAPRCTTPPASSVSADAAADHRDVHLGARDEAQIGVRRARRRARQAQADAASSPGAQRGLARPGAELLDRHLARRRPGPRSRTARAGGDQRRHGVGGRRGVAQVAAQRGPALDLRRADQVGRLDHARPHGAQRRVLAEHAQQGVAAPMRSRRRDRARCRSARGCA